MADQAVVLCGGRGVRLRPLTDSLPKAMVDVAGRPFLATLIEQLGKQGIKRFILCTGYLGEQIKAYFGDGSCLGVEISYSPGPMSWLTGRRLHEVQSMLDETFLLVYSDNFAAVDVVALVDQHLRSGVTATLSVVHKSEGNVSGTGSGATYKLGRSDCLPYVEIGYMVVERDLMLGALKDLPAAPNVDFADVLVALSDSRSIGAVEAHGGYQSISDPGRLERTREFMLPKRVLLMDRDGTINEKPPRGEYVNRLEDFRFIEGTVDAMARLAREGFEFVVITNQAGVARGMVDPEELERIHEEMVSVLAEREIKIKEVYVSPHHWDDEASERKPNPGLFYKASQELKFRLDRVVYVGDDIRDCQAAANAGCGMVYIAPEHGDRRMPVSRMPQWTVRTLNEAVPIISAYYNSFEK